MNARASIALAVAIGSGWPGGLEAMIFLEATSPQYHSTTPGDNSGWQYEGKFQWSLGVPISPYYFITAQHVGGNIGDTFDLHGDLYTTIGYHDSLVADLRIWEVNHAKPFPTYAPLSSGVNDRGALATVFGRGKRHGDEVIVGGESKGWEWGNTGVSDQVKRWGRNIVVDDLITIPGYGELLYCDFDNPGVDGECHLATGDSGGGLFVMEGGLWRLAGINLTVDGPFRTIPAGTPFSAALYDVGGLEYLSDDDPVEVWTPVAEQVENIASSFYVSRISASVGWISTWAPEVGALATESFTAWRKLYFTPAQIATPATSGPLEDPDGDGIGNLLEFALHLDPLFNERASMIPGTGLRGLPLVRVETILASQRVTIEFVRRTVGSGSGLSYVPQFSSDLADWQAVGTETVTPINARWERVKIVDALTVNDTPRRFARVAVTLAE